MHLTDAINCGWFNFVHRRNLVYNACWEDPRIDRQALAIGPRDTLAVITSAGCNVLRLRLAQAPRRGARASLLAHTHVLASLVRVGQRAPRSDHVPYLKHRLEVEHFSEHHARIPYLPLLRPPFYLFIGRHLSDRT
jgi:hypothetical protein